MLALAFRLTIVVAILLTCRSAGHNSQVMDKDRMQGTWVSNEMNGKKTTSEMAAVFSGHRFTLFADGDEVFQGTFSLDEAKKPKWINAKIGVPEGGEMVDIIGIYEVDRDTLKMCWGVSSERATEFRSTNMTDMCVTYKLKSK